MINAVVSNLSSLNLVHSRRGRKEGGRRRGGGFFFPCSEPVGNLSSILERLVGISMLDTADSILSNKVSLPTKHLTASLCVPSIKGCRIVGGSSIRWSLENQIN